MKKICLMLAFLFCMSGISLALQGKTASDDDIANLKQDILNGKVSVGKTRLKDFRRQYGESKNITISDRRVVYDFGDLKIEFDKQRLWRKWEYDSFKKAAYTDDIDDLRYDLESKKLVGDNITALKIIKDYGDPTEAMESSEDGEWTTYYYGNIKLVFENIFILDNFKGKNLESASEMKSSAKSGSGVSENSSSQVK